jgi:hypothetical protein
MGTPCVKNAGIITDTEIHPVNSSATVETQSQSQS